MEHTGFIPMIFIQPSQTPYFELRNIEMSFARRTFDKMDPDCDAMDNIAFHLENLYDGGKWIPELSGYRDPESL